MAQFGRALALGARGRRFKSCHSDHLVVFNRALGKGSRKEGYYVHFE